MVQLVKAQMQDNNITFDTYWTQAMIHHAISICMTIIPQCRVHLVDGPHWSNSPHHIQIYQQDIWKSPVWRVPTIIRTELFQKFIIISALQLSLYIPDFLLQFSDIPLSSYLPPRVFHRLGNLCCELGAAANSFSSTNFHFTWICDYWYALYSEALHILAFSWSQT